MLCFVSHRKTGISALGADSEQLFFFLHCPIQSSFRAIIRLNHFPLANSEQLQCNFSQRNLFSWSIPEQLRCSFWSTLFDFSWPILEQFRNQSCRMPFSTGHFSRPGSVFDSTAFSTGRPAALKLITDAYPTTNPSKPTTLIYRINLYQII